MKVHVIFSHPSQGIRDVRILKATSLEAVVKKLTDEGCTIIHASEEGENT